MRRNRWAVATTFLVSVALLGCGGDGSSVDPNEDLSGLWSFSDSLLNWGRGKTCTTGRGTLTITQQTGATFGGSLTDETTCLVIDTTNIGVRAGPISVGTISGSQVSFEVAFCEYVATTSDGDPPTQMIGTETCILHFGSTDSSFSNSDWQATR